ncbi:MAG TPA: CocE/NonD family hydrolase, partial [Candidatus Binatia bacterium]|nr:CocE/NonD family hydrolase [Candidatus Binatia bacterium]
GGWMDSYVDAAFRMQARCDRAAERSVIVGPWSHDLPDSARPGPTLDWLDDLTRFLDRHLRDVVRASDVDPPGDDDPPPVRWFERTWTEPTAFPERLAGRWRSAGRYPPPGRADDSWVLSGGNAPGQGTLVHPGIGGSAGADRPSGSDSVRHRATVGTTAALSWGAGGPPNGLGRDPRPDDAFGVTYTSPPLEKPIAILGSPEALLHVSADAPIATAVARLFDVAPDGTPCQVSAGVLDLTHRHGHVDPEPLTPDHVESIVVPLRSAGYRFEPGHRIRLTIATQAWPVIWPSPLPVTLTIHHGPGQPSALSLPTIPLEDDAPLDPRWVREAGTDRRRAVGGGSEEPPEWRIEEDVLAGTVTVRTFEGGTTILEDGRSLYTSERLAMTAAHDDPAHASLESDVVYRWRERMFATDIRATGRTTSGADDFTFDLHLEVDVDGERFFERSWHEVVPRRLV